MRGEGLVAGNGFVDEVVRMAIALKTLSDSTTCLRSHVLTCSLTHTALRACLVAAPLVLLTSCSDNGLGMVRVNGQVTFEGREFPQHCKVYFSPIEVPEGLPKRPAACRPDEDGRLSVTSWKEGDGLVPGTYEVTVQYYEPIPGADLTSDEGWVGKSHQVEDLVIEPGTPGPIEVSYTVPKPK